MSGSNYNVSVCQVLENERALKLSNVLKLYNRKDYVRKDRSSFMEFISTFETHEDDLYRSHPENFDSTHYMSLLTFEGVS